MTARRLVPTDQQLVRSLRSQARSQALGDARLKLRDPSQLGEPRGWFGQSTTPGGCVTATSSTRVFDPDSLGGGGGETSRWQPRTAMNLIAVTGRSTSAPSGDDFVVYINDAFTASNLVTLTFADGVDDTISWTGSVALTSSSLLYFQVASTVTMELLCLQAWFDNSAGGGLIIYPDTGL